MCFDRNFIDMTEKQMPSLRLGKFTSKDLVATQFRNSLDFVRVAGFVQLFSATERKLPGGPVFHVGICESSFESVG